MRMIDNLFFALQADYYADSLEEIAHLHCPLDMIGVFDLGNHHGGITGQICLKGNTQINESPSPSIFLLIH